ncbi:MAG: LPS translocon maturation chaperone LptM [Rubrivivax sp.]
MAWRVGSHQPSGLAAPIMRPMQTSVATPALPLRAAVLWLALALATALAGCGQRGPLRLPDAAAPSGKPSAPVTAPAATPSAPSTSPATRAGPLVPPSAASAPRP